MYRINRMKSESPVANNDSKTRKLLFFIPSILSILSKNSFLI